MRLTFGDLQSLLTLVHGVDDRKRITLKGRLQHFQRMRFPEGVSVGKGPKVVYDFDQVLQLAISFQLSACRLPPVYVARLVADAWPGIRGQVLHCYTLASEGTRDHRIWLVIEPDGLGVLRRPDSSEDDEMDRIEVVQEDLLHAMLLGGSGSTIPRLLTIDLHGLCSTIAGFVAGLVVEAR